MPVLERSTLIPNRTPELVLDFCLEGLSFPKIFAQRVTLLSDIDLSNLRIEAGRQLRFRHWMFNVIPLRTVVVREVGDHHFIDEMLEGPMAAFRHEHRVEAVEGGTLYTDRVTYKAIGGAPLEWLVVNGYMQRIFAARHRNMLRLLG